MDYACGCPGTCPCGAITLQILEPCAIKRAGKPCQVIGTHKQVSIMPCAKHYVAGSANVLHPGPIFQAHADCQSPPGPSQRTPPMPVSPTQRGIFPLIPGLIPGQTAVHPGILGMRKYREHERNAMIGKHQAERRERSGGQRTGETWQPDNTTKGALVQRHPSYNPIAAQAIPVPQLTTFNPTAPQPIPLHRRKIYAAALATKPAAHDIGPQRPPTHRDQGWSNLEWSIPQDGPLCFAAIKEAPLVEERRLTDVAAWVEENTTYYYPEQEAKARADAEAISAEQARILEEVRRAEAKVQAEIAARGRGLRRKGFEEVEGIAVGGWAGDGAGGRGENARFDGEYATGRRVVGGPRGFVGKESESEP